MRFHKHLFISYAHIDNQPLTPEQQGWITRFHAALESFLSMRMGGEARIWRSNKLQGNDIFGDEIVEIPDRIIGSLLVVKAQPEASVAVTRSKITTCLSGTKTSCRITWVALLGS